jgi:hypothetical protein
MPIAFAGYHTAHFSLVIGADQKNYLATEVRYQPEHLLADLAKGWSKEILWRPERLHRIARVVSSSYPAKGSRNRGVLYNTLIEQLRTGQQGLDDVCARIPAGGFLLPHII